MSPSKIKVLLIFSVINSCLANSWKEGTMLCPQQVSDGSVGLMKNTQIIEAVICFQCLFSLSNHSYEKHINKHLSLNVSFGIQMTNNWIEIILSTDQIRMTVTVASVTQQRK